jgi:hypothetical protein
MSVAVKSGATLPSAIWEKTFPAPNTSIEHISKFLIVMNLFLE